MRKINTRTFQLATRNTQRDVNRRIVLNLIREFQPISRAELARRMKVRRGTITTLVKELLESGAVQEMGAVTAVRGRRPTMLTLATTGRFVIAADVRPGETRLALADASGHLVARAMIPTPATPEKFGERLAEGMSALVAQHTGGASVARACLGAGIVLPGMIDRTTGRLLYAPVLGWRDVDLRTGVAKRLGVKTYIESAPIACALAQLWLAPEETRGLTGFAYVHVSDGLGVGLVINGEAVRGDMHSAGEFGHVSLDPNGPICVCGRRGCWEALANNAATIARYRAAAAGGANGNAGAGDPRRKRAAASPTPAIGIHEIVRRARLGDTAAATALTGTAQQLGRGIAMVIAAFNPGRIYVGGEISAAWNILDGAVRAVVQAAAIPEAAGATPIVPARHPGENRLQGAVALVNAPTFAALDVG
jgi:predicted NBD/HSP70 family sugar kinase